MPYKDPLLAKQNHAEYYQKNKATISRKNRLWYLSLSEDKKALIRQRTKESYKRRFTDKGISHYLVYMASLSEKEKQKHRKRHSKYGKRYYERHKTEINKRLHQNYLRRRLYKYGINEISYRDLLQKQNNVCAICAKPNSSKVIKYKDIYPLMVDHSHKTNLVRGLLCHQCNILLGMAQEDKAILQSAIKYLEKDN